MRLRYDFHIHSCLSPCGDNEMTPYNLVNLAKLLGFDVIALTDHNCCENCPAAVRAGEAAGLLVLPGMELCTSEEAHVVCLFETCAQALNFSAYVGGHVPPVANRPEIFGEQRVMDAADTVLALHDTLLTTACDISVEDVRALVASYGGVCFPAHIDRPSYSVISSLGVFSPDWGFPAAELTREADVDQYRADYPALRALPLLCDSDAHYLEDMKEPCAWIEAGEKSAAAVLATLRGDAPLRWGRE